MRSDDMPPHRPRLGGWMPRGWRTRMMSATGSQRITAVAPCKDAIVQQGAADSRRVRGYHWLRLIWPHLPKSFRLHRQSVLSRDMAGRNGHRPHFHPGFFLETTLGISDRASPATSTSTLTTADAFEPTRHLPDAVIRHNVVAQVSGRPQAAAKHRCNLHTSSGDRLRAASDLPRPFLPCPVPSPESRWSG